MALGRKHRDYSKRPFSPREWEVVMLVVSGHQNKTIALRLGISTHTVREHLRRLFAAHHLRSRTELAVFALQVGAP